MFRDIFKTRVIEEEKLYEMDLSKIQSQEHIIALLKVLFIVLAQSKTVKFKEHVFTDFPMLKELIKDE
jgi:hypothetical protein